LNNATKPGSVQITLLFRGAGLNPEKTQHLTAPEREKKSGTGRF